MKNHFQIACALLLSVMLAGQATNVFAQAAQGSAGKANASVGTARPNSNINNTGNINLSSPAGTVATPGSTLGGNVILGNPAGTVAIPGSTLGGKVALGNPAGTMAPSGSNNCAGGATATTTASGSTTNNCADGSTGTAATSGNINSNVGNPTGTGR